LGLFSFWSDRRNPRCLRTHSSPPGPYCSFPTFEMLPFYTMSSDTLPPFCSFHFFLDRSRPFWVFSEFPVSCWCIRTYSPSRIGFSLVVALDSHPPFTFLSPRVANPPDLITILPFLPRWDQPSLSSLYQAPLFFFFSTNRQPSPPVCRPATRFSLSLIFTRESFRVVFSQGYRPFSPLFIIDF